MFTSQIKIPLTHFIHTCDNTPFHYWTHTCSLSVERYLCLYRLYLNLNVMFKELKTWITGEMNMEHGKIRNGQEDQTSSYRHYIRSKKPMRRHKGKSRWERLTAVRSSSRVIMPPSDGHIFFHLWQLFIRTWKSKRNALSCNVKIVFFKSWISLVTGGSWRSVVSCDLIWKGFSSVVHHADWCCRSDAHTVACAAAQSEQIHQLDQFQQPRGGTVGCTLTIEPSKHPILNSVSTTFHPTAGQVEFFELFKRNLWF